MASRFDQGWYMVKNPDKYLGDVNEVRFMSSWELNAFNFLDGNPNVLKWGSEEIAIPYIKPTDGRVHKYLPDLIVQYRDKEGVEKWELLEIKPAAQVKVSRARNPNTRTYQNLTLAVNTAKWAAAQQWCEAQQKNGMAITFRILTEHSIFK